MTAESGVIAAVILGFLLGFKHATDADHVLAVSTIVNEYRNIFRGLWIGASWGLGHTVPLLVVGLIILAFKGPVMDVYENIAPVFEFGVGIMLVFLGIQVYWNLRKGLLHTHQHAHDGTAHLHIHGTHEPIEDPDVEKQHGMFKPGKPFFRVKSFIIGSLHGLAGTAAVMLALLPTTSAFLSGILYIVMFGIGTILSMAIITIVLGIPFVLSGGHQKVNNIINGTAGAASTLFGFALMSDIALGTQIIPF